MTDYDSILKEKKIYVEPPKTKKEKKFPWLLLDLLFITLILIVSYIIYYNKILSPDNLFYMNINNIMKEYQKVAHNLNLDGFGDDYQLKGTFLYEEEKYNVGIIRNSNKIKLAFANDDSSLAYYIDNQNKFIKLSNFSEEYITLNEKNSFHDYKDLSNQFSQYITKDNYIKKFYLEGINPIVETNLVLKQDKIQNILGNISLKEQYEIIFTFKNHAFTSQALSMKMVINELSANKRYAVLYQEGELSISNSKDLNLKLTLETKNQDFTLKIYKNDSIYSVLSGTKQEDDYLYKYQVIDKIYNISLKVSKEINHYSYHLTSNIEREGETVQKEAELIFDQLENIILDENTATSKSYSNLTEEEKNNYTQILDKTILPLRQFIKEHQESIN